MAVQPRQSSALSELHPHSDSLADVLGAYVVRLDEDGTLRGYRRERRFQRSDAEAH